jgi:hypothetical protein
MKIIHMDQKRLRMNKNLGTRHPPVRVQDGDKVEFCMGVNINGPSRVVYRPDEPLPSLARLWVETDADLEIINHTDSPAPKEG